MNDENDDLVSISSKNTAVNKENKSSNVKKKTTVGTTNKTGKPMKKTKELKF